jgi:hypothetical protein
MKVIRCLLPLAVLIVLVGCNSAEVAAMLEKYEEVKGA